MYTATAVGSEPANTTRASALLQRWFVDYNPLQLLSACLMLCGVWLVAKHLEAVSSRYGDLWLLGVLEVYQLMVLAGAALLMRLGYRRGAGFLGLLAAGLFFGDPTFQLEQLVTMGRVGLLVAGLWLVLLVAKVGLLCRIFTLRLSWGAWASVVLAGASVAFLPLALHHRWLSVSGISAVVHVIPLLLMALSLLFGPRGSNASTLVRGVARWLPIAVVAYHGLFLVVAHVALAHLWLHFATAALVVVLVLRLGLLFVAVAMVSALLALAFGGMAVVPLFQCALVGALFALRERQLRYLALVAVGALFWLFDAGLLPLPRTVSALACCSWGWVSSCWWEGW